MKKNCTHRRLALLGLTMLLFAATATAQNMNRYVTLNVRQGEQIVLEIKAPVGSETPVRIVSGSTDETILVSYWSDTYSFYAGADTMTIYGDITGLDCVDNGAKIKQAWIRKTAT